MKPKAYSYVRFSSPEQEKGDSLRRQVEQAREYAEARGLTLDDTLSLTDRGLSAYKGKNRDEGALGEFLRLIESGDVPRGSLLIVESLDRLSRERVLPALRQFSSIVESGVRLVTLQDGMEYSEESINQNWAQLIVSITYMARAHEESAAKAARLSAAWDNKRSRAVDNGHKLTGKAPAWLTVERDDAGKVRRFHVAEQPAQAVGRIFDLKLEGVGSEKIARLLNEDPEIWKPHYDNRQTSGWRKSYVSKLLTFRAVIGEYQPHTKVDGHRQPVGEPIPDYYPAIVDRDKFERVQRILRQRGQSAGRGGGRTGQVNNLFTYVATCTTCGGRLRFENKGRSPKGGQYLICDTAKRGGPCNDRARLRYDYFENTILGHCRGLDVSEVLDDQTQRDELAELRRTLDSVEGQLGDAQRRADNALAAVTSTDHAAARQAYQGEYERVLDQRTELEARAAALREQIEAASRAERDVARQLDDIQSLMGYMADLDGEERVRVRQRLRAQLAEIIQSIEVTPSERWAVLWLGPKSGSPRRRFARRVG